MDSVPSRLIIGSFLSTLAKADLGAGETFGRISCHPGFTPASKDLRGPLVTSHNIYYVKSNILVRGCLRVCILLILCLMRQADIPDVNNSSTKLACCRWFGAQTVKTTVSGYISDGRSVVMQPCHGTIRQIKYNTGIKSTVSTCDCVEISASIIPGNLPRH